MKKEIIKFVSCILLFLITFFIPKNELYFIILLLLYFVLSYDIWLAVFKNIKTLKFMDEKFLMIVATVGAFAIHEYPEAVAVVLFYQIGEFLSDKATNTTKEEIKKLMDLKIDVAHVKKNGKMDTVLLEQVQCNDIIIVNPGEKIPLDGIIISGKSRLDTSSMTGESMLRTVEKNDIVMSGCINQDGVIEIKTTTDYKNSTVSKVMALMEEASKYQSSQEKFITKFAKYYTPIVVAISIMITIIPLCFGGTFNEFFYKSLVFLVISCPCALVVSIPLGFFSGIGVCGKKGILIKKSVVLENLDQIDTVIFDKTGTLTKGDFKIQKILPYHTTEEDVLKYAVLAESHSNHPIAKAIQNVQLKKIDEIQHMKEVAGKGIETVYQDKTILVGNELLMEEHHIVYPKIDEMGTVIYVTFDHRYMGAIVIGDTLKPNIKRLVHKLKQNGVDHVIMLSGDNEKTVSQVGKYLHMDNCYANLLPNDKVEIVKTLNQTFHTMFIGDGINDAPVLMCSNIGVSMGGIGSDAAIEASDIVIMNDNPNLIITALQIAKKTKQIVKMNMGISIFAKVMIMILGLLGMVSMWLAVFADVGIMLLTILNTLRIFTIKTT